MKRLVIALLTSLVFSPCWAGDEALYDESAPADVSFFRFANMTAKTINISLDGKILASLPASKVSPYGFVSASDVTFDIDGYSLSMTAVARQQVTIAWQGEGNGGHTMVKEEVFENKRKARLKLYNFTDKSDITLKTEDGRHEVLKDVQPLKMDSRDVNAIKSGFAAYQENTVLASSGPISLVRDKVTSLFLFDQSGVVRLFAVESER